MLVLSRKVGQELIIGDNVRITINRVGGSRVTLGIEAPDDVRVVRGELEPIVRAFEQEADPSDAAETEKVAKSASVESRSDRRQQGAHVVEKSEASAVRFEAGQSARGRGPKSTKSAASPAEDGNPSRMPSRDVENASSPLESLVRRLH